MSRILPCVLRRQRFGAGHAVSLPEGSSWLGADPHQPAHVGFPFSRKALKQRWFYCAVPALGSSASLVLEREWWGVGTARAGCPQCSMLLGHMFSPTCKPSPSVSTSELPLWSPLASPWVPGDPKPAACCPSCAAMTFGCCQEKGSCSRLHWKKQQLFSPTLCSLQNCGFAADPELGLSNAIRLRQVLDPAGATLDASGAGRVHGPG